MPCEGDQDKHGEHQSEKRDCGSDFSGDPIRPFSWKEIDAKFDKLAGGHATKKSREKIKNAVHSPEDTQVSDLMKMLSELKG